MEGNLEELTKKQATKTGDILVRVATELDGLPTGEEDDNNWDCLTFITSEDMSVYDAIRTSAELMERTPTKNAEYVSNYFDLCEDWGYRLYVNGDVFARAGDINTVCGIYTPKQLQEIQISDLAVTDEKSGERKVVFAIPMPRRRYGVD